MILGGGIDIPKGWENEALKCYERMAFCNS